MFGFFTFERWALDDDFFMTFSYRRVLRREEDGRARSRRHRGLRDRRLTSEPAYTFRRWSFGYVLLVESRSMASRSADLAFDVDLEDDRAVIAQAANEFVVDDVA